MFIAAEVPAAWQQGLSAAAESLEARVPGVSRWVRPEGFHVTLAFLGNQPGRLLSTIQAATHEVREVAPAFTIRPGRLGFFGSRHEVRVVWAALETDPPDRLRSARAAVVAALRRHSVSFDAGPFRPHITLGRIRRGTSAEQHARLIDAIDAAPPWAVGTALVSEIVLFQSQLHPQGSIYHAVSRHALGTETTPLPSPPPEGRR